MYLQIPVFHIWTIKNSIYNFVKKYMSHQITIDSEYQSEFFFSKNKVVGLEGLKKYSNDIDWLEYNR